MTFVLYYFYIIVYIFRIILIYYLIIFIIHYTKSEKGYNLLLTFWNILFLYIIFSNISLFLYIILLIYLLIYITLHDEWSFMLTWRHVSCSSFWVWPQAYWTSSPPPCWSPGTISFATTWACLSRSSTWPPSPASSRMSTKMSKVVFFFIKLLTLILHLGFS